MTGRLDVTAAELDALLATRGVMLPLDVRADRSLVPVRRIVGAFAELIGDDDVMIAASYAFQSVVSRLAAPILTAASLFGVAPDVGFDDIRWSIGAYGPTVGAGTPSVVTMSPDDALDLVLGTIDRWAEAMRAEVRIARRLLMGDAAASLLATLRRIAAQPGVEPKRAEGLAGRAIEALGRPVVAELVDVDGWTTFQRRTCCLLRFAGRARDL